MNKAMERVKSFN